MDNERVSDAVGAPRLKGSYKNITPLECFVLSTKCESDCISIEARDDARECLVGLHSLATLTG